MMPGSDPSWAFQALRAELEGTWKTQADTGEAHPAPPPQAVLIKRGGPWGSANSLRLKRRLSERLSTTEL